MEVEWLRWAKRLHGIAATGLHFGSDEFDKERYREVADIAQAMLAALGVSTIERIRDLVSESARGYATPKIDVRGAVIDAGRILLVQERSDGLWTLPGGYADVGRSPAENVTKEIWEEAGIRVAATALYGIRHKAKHEYTPDVRDFYKLFFLCTKTDRANPVAGGETCDVGWFEPKHLPALSKGRCIEKDIRAAFAFAEDPRARAHFD